MSVSIVLNLFTPHVPPCKELRSSALAGQAFRLKRKLLLRVESSSKEPVTESVDTVMNAFHAYNVHTDAMDVHGKMCAVISQLAGSGP